MPRRAPSAPSPRAEPPPEFSRLVDVSRLGARAQEVRIEANPAECAALARRFGLASLDRLVARLVFRRRGDGLIELEGELDAAYVQDCVATGEPLAQVQKRRFAQYFGGAAPRDVEAADPLDDAAFPEPLAQGRLDAGEAAAQELAAEIDPYPRKPGA